MGGLVVGGIAAAPLAGYVIKALPERLLLRAVGALIICLASYQTLAALGSPG